MNNLTTYQSNLPDNVQDLAKFILIGQEKLKSVKAEIRAINKLELAKSVMEQKLEEARMISEALLDAQVKFGEFTKTLPTARGLRSDLQTPKKNKATSSPQDEEVKPKEQAVKNLGFKYHH